MFNKTNEQVKVASISSAPQANQYTFPLLFPSGNPEHPHQRKHAFDLGEYGAGYMTNSLTLGCDCKGSIHYLDADFPARDGSVRTIKNAVCIHEEDSGILFKHSDFRDDSTIVTRARKLIVQQIFTAANYEYAIQVWSLFCFCCCCCSWTKGS